MSRCVLCDNLGGTVLYNCDLFRIVLVEDKHYVGYLRIILNNHIKELTDLADENNLTIYQALMQCEKILRQVFKPEKINLASFGNMMPHVHWHIIPRFKNDLHFPNSIWGEVINPSYIPSQEQYALAQQLIQEFNQYFVTK